MLKANLQPTSRRANTQSRSGVASEPLAVVASMPRGGMRLSMESFLNCPGPSMNQSMKRSMKLSKKRRTKVFAKLFAGPPVKQIVKRPLKPSMGLSMMRSMKCP